MNLLNQSIVRVGVMVALLPGACATVPSTTDHLRGFEHAPALKVEPTSARYTKSYALLIGNSQYLHGWGTLGSVPAELDSVDRVLVQHGFEVTRHSDLDGAALRAVYEKFIQEHGLGDPDVRLLFFFSGHGHTDGEKGYIVGTDAPEPSPLTHPGPDFLRKSLPMSQFVEWGRQIKAKHALFVFDSCFSGSILNERGDPPAIATYIGLPTRQFLTAGRAGETVPGISIFAEMFVDALSAEQRKGDLNGDGYVTAAELGLYLKYSLPNRRPKQHPQFALHPDAEFHEGDMIFTLAPAQGGATKVEQPSPPSPDPNGDIRYKSDDSAYLRLDGVDVEIPKSKLDKLIEQNERQRIENSYDRLRAAAELKMLLTEAAREQLRARERLIRLRTITWAGGGTAFAVAAGFMVRMLQKESDAEPSCMGDLCQQPGYDLRRQSRTAGNVATGLFYAGVALGVAGALLEYFAPDVEKPGGRRGLSLQVSAAGVGASW